MNIKINMKSLINYEMMTNKSFYEFDLTSESDMLILLYNIVLTNNDEKFSYDEFVEIMKSTKLYKEVFEKFNFEMNLIQQYIKKEIKIETKNVEAETEIKNEKVFLKDVVATLIIHCQIDINYVMFEMKMYEIEFLIKSHNEKTKQEMEQNRLWTWFSMLPHIDSKSIQKSPKGLILFPWEDEIEPEKEIEFVDFQKIIENNNNIFKNENIKNNENK
jgi:hypothetical protein